MCLRTFTSVCKRGTYSIYIHVYCCKYAERWLCLYWVAMVIWEPDCVCTVWVSCARYKHGCITVSVSEEVEIKRRTKAEVCMPKYVCIIFVFWPSWADSRVICGEGFSSLAVSLDGLHGGGVEDPLTHRSPPVPPCLALLEPLSLALVQDVNPEQQTVVHDLKTLQHLQGVTYVLGFRWKIVFCKDHHEIHCRTRNELITNGTNWKPLECNNRKHHIFYDLFEHWRDYSPGLDAWPSDPDGIHSDIMKYFEKHFLFGSQNPFITQHALATQRPERWQKEISV